MFFFNNQSPFTTITNCIKKVFDRFIHVFLQTALNMILSIVISLFLRIFVERFFVFVPLFWSERFDAENHFVFENLSFTNNTEVFFEDNPNLLPRIFT